MASPVSDSSSEESESDEEDAEYETEDGDYSPEELSDGGPAPAKPNISRNLFIDSDSSELIIMFFRAGRQLFIKWVAIVLTPLDVDFLVF